MNKPIECKLVSGHIQYDGVELDNLPDQDMVLIPKTEWDKVQYVLVNQKRMINNYYGNVFDRVLYANDVNTWVKDRVSRIGDNIIKGIKDDNTNN